MFRGYDGKNISLIGLKTDRYLSYCLSMKGISFGMYFLDVLLLLPGMLKEWGHEELWKSRVVVILGGFELVLSES